MKAVRLQQVGTAHLPAACARSQSVLLEFAELGQSSPQLRRALEHLGTCNECERSMAQTAMVLSALRRLADDVSRAEPSPAAWPKIRAAAVAPRRNHERTWHSAGLVAGLAMLLVLVAPKAILQPRLETAAPQYEPTLDATWYANNPAPRGPVVMSRALEVSDTTIPEVGPEDQTLVVWSSMEHVK